VFRRSFMIVAVHAVAAVYGAFSRALLLVTNQPTHVKRGRSENRAILLAFEVAVLGELLDNSEDVFSLSSDRRFVLLMQLCGDLQHLDDIPE
jgi:hypothetical protein